MPIAGLPPALHGFTIAQISDIHVGPTIKRRLRRARSSTRSTARRRHGRGHRRPGRRLACASWRRTSRRWRGCTSRHGTFFVTGNHEYYSGAPAWIVELRRLGLTRAAERARGAAPRRGLPGRGRRHRLRRPPLRAGSIAATRPRPSPARRPMPQARCCWRTSRAAPMAAAAAGFDLQLSGHTHGGQFLPWNFFVRLQQPFTAGLHRLARAVGLHQPRHRLLGPAQAPRRAVRDHPAAAGDGGRPLTDEAGAGFRAALQSTGFASGVVPGVHKESSRVHFRSLRAGRPGRTALPTPPSAASARCCRWC